MGAAAAGVYLGDSDTTIVDSQRYAGRCQLCQCRLHIDRCQPRVRSQALVQPGQVESLLAGAARPCFGEIGVIEQVGQQWPGDGASRRPLAIVIIVSTGMAFYPVVQQCIARPGIKPQAQFHSSQQGGIGDAANVDDRPVDSRPRKCGGVESRRQRRALAPGGDIPAPEVGNRGDAGGLGDGVGVTKLQGKAVVAGAA